MRIEIIRLDMYFEATKQKINFVPVFVVKKDMNMLHYVHVQFIWTKISVWDALIGNSGVILKIVEQLNTNFISLKILHSTHKIESLHTLVYYIVDVIMYKEMFWLLLSSTKQIDK